MAGTLAHSPAHVVAKLLIELGVGIDPATSGEWPVFSAGTPSTPDEVISVFDTVGRLHGRTHPDGETQQHHGIMVRVRSKTHPEGWSKANEISQAFDGIHQDFVTVGGVQYRVQAVHRTGDINAVGTEPSVSKRSVFTINALVVVRQDL